MKEELKDFSFVLNEDEEIKQIIDFPDYWISNYGRVFSYKNSYKTRKGWKELKQYSDKNHHYLDCRISVKGKALHLPVHRYVCKYFCPGYKEGFVVNHIDGNTKNNYYKNLEWTTQKTTYIKATLPARLMQPETITLLNFMTHKGNI